MCLKEKGVGEIVRSGVESVKSLDPFNIVGKRRQLAAEALDKAGVTIDETQIAEDLLDYASNKAPLTMRNKAQDYALQAIDVFKNPNAKIVDVLDTLSTANESAFLQSGTKGRAIASKIEKVVGDSIRKQLKDRAPDVAKANKQFEILYKGKKLLKYLKFPAAIATGTAVFK